MDRGATRLPATHEVDPGARSGASTRRPGVAPVRETTAHRIAASLRQEILSMRLPPRTALQEKALTDRFQVSRTPVREALIRLAEEDLVSIYPQSGTFVAPIPIASIQEAVIVRLALEMAALDLLLERAGTVDLEPLDRTVTQLRVFAEIGDAGGFHEADEAFHGAIAELSGHPGIWRVAQSAKTQIDRCRRLTLPVEGRMAQVIAEHAAIIAGIRAGEAAAARAQLKAHLSMLIPDLATLREAYPDYFV